MSATGTRAGNLRLVGGRLCLDFVNTVDWRAGDHPVEWLRNDDDLIDWARHAGLTHDVSVARATGVVALEQALELRETLYRIFTAIAEGSAPPDADLDAFSATLAALLGRARLAAREDGSEYSWRWRDGSVPPDWMLLPIALSAARLLTSAAHDRVKVCDGPACGWLFLDTSRNRSRRWCSMESCGNRAKARRYFQRHR